MEVRLLDIPELCLRLRVSRSTVEGLLRRGVLPSLRIGRSRRVRLDQLVNWIQEQQAAEEQSNPAAVEAEVRDADSATA